MIFMLSIFFSLSFGPVSWVLASEVFPTNTRAIGTSVATCSNWVSTPFTTNQLKADARVRLSTRSSDRFRPWPSRMSNGNSTLCSSLSTSSISYLYSFSSLKRKVNKICIQNLANLRLINHFRENVGRDEQGLWWWGSCHESGRRYTFKWEGKYRACLSRSSSGHMRVMNDDSYERSSVT